LLRRDAAYAIIEFVTRNIFLMPRCCLAHSVSFVDLYADERAFDRRRCFRRLRRFYYAMQRYILYARAMMP